MLLNNARHATHTTVTKLNGQTIKAKYYQHAKLYPHGIFAAGGVLVPTQEKKNFAVFLLNTLCNL